MITYDQCKNDALSELEAWIKSVNFDPKDADVFIATAAEDALPVSLANLVDLFHSPELQKMEIDPTQWCPDSSVELILAEMARESLEKFLWEQWEEIHP